MRGRKCKLTMRTHRASCVVVGFDDSFHLRSLVDSQKDEQSKHAGNADGHGHVINSECFLLVGALGSQLV